MAEPIRLERDDTRRRRELAESLAYAARAARDPELERRLAEAQAALTAGEADDTDLIDYEALLERIRGRRAP